MGRGKKERGTQSQARERISDQSKTAAILKAPPHPTHTRIHRERERIREIRRLGFFHEVNHLPSSFPAAPWL